MLKLVLLPLFHQREVMDMLSHFCNAHMKELVFKITDSQIPRNTEDREEGDSDTQPIRDSKSDPFTIQSMVDLGKYQRDRMFRSTFRLPLTERPDDDIVTMMETKSIADAREGTLFVSRHFLCYMSGSDSLKGNDESRPWNPALTLVIPFSDILEIKQETSPSAANMSRPGSGTFGGLATMGAASIVSSQAISGLMSFMTARPHGSIAISVKSRFKYWFTTQQGLGQDLFEMIEKRWRASEASTTLLKTLEIQTSQSVITHRGSTMESHRSSGGSTRGESTDSGSGTLVSDVDDKDGAIGDQESMVPLPFSLQHIFARQVDDQAKAAIKYGSSTGTEATLNEMDQECDWVDYFAMYGRDACMIKAISLQTLVMRGIPESFRPQLWMVLSGGLYLRSNDETYALNLLHNNSKSSPILGEIEKDIKRSMPDHPAYQSPVGLGALRRVLVSYSWRNPAIGYAQSMNIVAAVMLLHLKEEDAFWLLATVCEEILPDYYSRTLVGVQIDQRVFLHLVGISLPTLAQHLRNLDLDLATITTPWFLCLYQSVLPLKAGIRVLDGVFLKGAAFLLSLGLAILKGCEKELLECENDEGVVMCLHSFLDRFKDKTAPVAQDAPAGEEHSTTGAGRKSPVCLEGSKVVPLGKGAAMAAAVAAAAVAAAGPRQSFERLLKVAFTDYGFITQADMDTLRDRFRMSVVAAMGQKPSSVAV